MFRWYLVQGIALIPNIWLRYMMLKMAPVAKVSVLNVLSKPVLSPLHLFMINWCTHLGKAFTEQDMLLLVFLAVVPGQINGVTELALLIVEMVSHQLLQLVYLTLVIRMVLNIQHDCEQALVLLIQLILLQVTTIEIT